MSERKDSSLRQTPTSAAGRRSLYHQPPELGHHQQSTVASRSVHSVTDRNAKELDALQTLSYAPHRPTSSVIMAQEVSTTYSFEARSMYRDSFRCLYEFFQKGVLCDVEIVCGSKAIRCHRVVLACTSTYFKTMFTSEMAEAHQSSIHIQDIDETALMQLIKFAYTARMVLTTDNVQGLLYASSILQVETVASACCEFMKTHLHPTNCIGIRNFAEQHGRIELISKADQFTRENFMWVVDSEEFSTMSHRHLLDLVASLDLNVNSEIQVYEAVMKWVKHNPEERKQHLVKLLGQVKLALLPPTYLLETVSNEAMIRNDLQCRDLLDKAKDYQLSLANVVPDFKLSDKILPRKSCAGVLFCVGGRGACGDPFRTIECYDLRQNRWFQVTDMSTRRRHVGVVAVGGKLYAVGGHDGKEHLNSGEVFDPSNNKWKPIAPMTTLRRGIALAYLGGPIYAIGGLDDRACFNTVERYDPSSDTWSSVQPMNYVRGGVAVAELKSRHSLQGYLYAIGGNDGTTSLDSCERYDPNLNRWTMVTPMNTRRAGAGVAELGGRLYIVGGFDDNSPLDSVEIYDPVTNKWTFAASMSCPRGGVGVAALGGKIYAVGGHDGSNYLSSVEAYDVLNDKWQLISSISTCRAGAGIAVIPCPIDQLKDVSKVNMSSAAGKPRRRACAARCAAAL